MLRKDDLNPYNLRNLDQSSMLYFTLLVKLYFIFVSITNMEILEMSYMLKIAEML